MAGTAKIFMNGRSQAVRLPKECIFDCDEVYVEKQGDRVILSAKAPTWDDFFDLEPAFRDDFLGRGTTYQQERDFCLMYMLDTEHHLRPERAITAFTGTGSRSAFRPRFPR